jgi:penicillin-binding protein 1A
MQTLRWVLTRIAGAVAVIVVLALLLLLLALPAVYVANAAVSTVEDDLLDIPPLPADDIEPLAETSLVFDAAGDELAELHGPIRRTIAELDEVPEITRHAVLATEDAGFYEHPGVDHESVIRATIRNLREGRAAEGASTITQQYVRQALLDPEQTIERKLQEVVWAVELEQQISKDEILERYLNTVYLGNGVYGFATAADHYFSKPVGDLDAAESALLAGVIRAPELNDPVSEPERAQARRDIVLRQMATAGFITDGEAEEARARDIELEIREEEGREEFWIDWVKRIVHDPRVDLQPGLQEAIGETSEERIQALFEGGLRIHTSLDPVVQSIAEEVVSERLPDPIGDPMGALITLDPEDGSVRAMSLGPKDFGPCPEDEEPCEVTNVNPAVPGIGGSGRQAGSAFKPVVAAAALDRGIGTDREYDTESGEEIDDCGPEDDLYAPHNYDREDHGEMEMAEAMRRSINVYFVKLARDAGVLSTVHTAQELGIVNAPNLDEDHFGPRSCSIGLGTVNVFPLEMTVAYGTFENGGVRCDPHVITEITDRRGEVLYSYEPSCERVLDPGTAQNVTSLLREPVGDDGTAGIVGAQVPGAVGKTGTTDSHVDAWFVGSAGGLTTSAWIGYEDPRPMESVEVAGVFHAQVTGGSLPAPMWASYKSSISQLDD